MPLQRFLGNQLEDQLGLQEWCGFFAHIFGACSSHLDGGVDWTEGKTYIVASIVCGRSSRRSHVGLLGMDDGVDWTGGRPDTRISLDLLVDVSDPQAVSRRTWRHLDVIIHLRAGSSAWMSELFSRRGRAAARGQSESS